MPALDTNYSHLSYNLSDKLLARWPVRPLARWPVRLLACSPVGPFACWPVRLLACLESERRHRDPLLDLGGVGFHQGDVLFGNIRQTHLGQLHAALAGVLAREVFDVRQVNVAGEADARRLVDARAHPLIFG